MEPYTRHLADQIKSALGDTTQGTLQKFDTLTSEWFQAQRSPGEQLKLEQELGYDHATGLWLIIWAIRIL